MTTTNSFIGSVLRKKKKKHIEKENILVHCVLRRKEHFNKNNIVVHYVLK